MRVRNQPIERRIAAVGGTLQTWPVADRMNATNRGVTRWRAEDRENTRGYTSLVSWKAMRMKMDALKVCCRWHHLKATGGVALLVGTWLTLVNQADVIASQGLDIPVLLKVVVNYLTPFIVSNVGLLARKV